MRKRVFVLGAALAALALAFSLTDWVLVRLCAGVTEENLERLRTGIRRHQVERILGKPAEYYTLQNDQGTTFHVGVWLSERREVTVYFDRYGWVTSVYYINRQGSWDGHLILPGDRGS